ncbi:MAG: biotin synthase BioB [Selenomonadales bacterium]|nr:biotin synthase BioB [Selenomonadales bacterium]
MLTRGGEFMKQLAKEIIAGRRLGRKDDLSVFLTADIEELCLGANAIREALCGNKADLCSIVNGRSGQCSEDCKFCAQSCHYHTDTETYTFRPIEEIVEEARRNETAGIHRFSIVTAGRSIKGDDLAQALTAYSCLREESSMRLCASHGLQTAEEFQQLKDAGVERYHSNIETSKRYFPNVCTTHTYEDKIANIKRAQAVGLEVCSGGIIGMGETWEDRIDMAVSLAELEIDSIPLNVLRPIAGTPFENRPSISNEDVLRTVAIFRYINPLSWIRIAAGRGQFADGGLELFRSGANAAITGDMLTTTGSNMNADVRMFRQLGYQLQ